MFFRCKKDSDMLFTFRKVFKENLPLMMKINRENTAVNKRKMNEVVKNSKKGVCPFCRLKQGQRKLLSETIDIII